MLLLLCYITMFLWRAVWPGGLKSCGLTPYLVSNLRENGPVSFVDGRLVLPKAAEMGQVVGPDGLGCHSGHFGAFNVLIAGLAAA